MLVAMLFELYLKPIADRKHPYRIGALKFEFELFLYESKNRLADMSNDVVLSLFNGVKGCWLAQQTLGLNVMILVSFK